MGAAGLGAMNGMEGQIDNNMEQFQMLYLSIENMSYGMCLYQAYRPENQLKIAREIQKRCKKKCLILNMSQIENEQQPDEIGKLRKLLDREEEAQVVFLCNIQICGLGIGDETYIHKLNYMRDQMMALEKVWVFGATPYFAMLLSRFARDLYSCIMNHFLFQDSPEHPFKVDDVEEAYPGDIRLNLKKFREFYMCLKNQCIRDIEVHNLLDVVSTWNVVYDCCEPHVADWIKEILLYFESDGYRHVGDSGLILNGNDIIGAWENLEDYQKALEAAQIVLKKTEQAFSENSRERIVIYKYLADIYSQLGKYDLAEEYINRVIAFYSTTFSDYSKEWFAAENIRNNVLTLTGRVDEAIDSYQALLQLAEKQLAGYNLAISVLWNNLAVCFIEKKEYSQALTALKKALAVLNSKEMGSKRKRVYMLKNIGYTYKMLGDYDNALDYLKKATQEAEPIKKLLNPQKMKEIKEWMGELGGAGEVDQ